MDGVGAVSHSIISGVFAASAGVAGKLAFDKTLITKGCIEIHSVLNSSEVLSRLEVFQLLPSFLQNTDVCDYQVRIWILIYNELNMFLYQIEFIDYSIWSKYVPPILFEISKNCFRKANDIWFRLSLVIHFLSYVIW